jgi:hypothetical protein
VQVRVELLGLAIDLLGGVKALETVLLQGVQEDVLGHLETGDELKEVLVLVGLGSGELIRGHGQQRAVKVVNAVKEVLGETLDGEVTGTVHVTLSALLEVAEVGDGAKVLVLKMK